MRMRALDRDALPNFESARESVICDFAVLFPVLIGSSPVRRLEGDTGNNRTGEDHCPGERPGPMREFHVTSCIVYPFRAGQGKHQEVRED
jgi:hypothetical protein